MEVKESTSLVARAPQDISNTKGASISRRKINRIVLSWSHSWVYLTVLQCESLSTALDCWCNAAAIPLAMTAQTAALAPGPEQLLVEAVLALFHY
jgi:hypothetical protein